MTVVNNFARVRSYQVATSGSRETSLEDLFKFLTQRDSNEGKRESQCFCSSFNILLCSLLRRNGRPAVSAFYEEEWEEWLFVEERYLDKEWLIRKLRKWD